MLDRNVPPIGVLAHQRERALPDPSNGDRNRTERDGTLLRGASMFGLRELAKLVPGYGQTAGAAAAAAASFATTYALGKAACLYLGMRRRGSVEQAKVIAAYRAALSEAFRLASEGDMFKSAGKDAR